MNSIRKRNRPTRSRAKLHLEGFTAAELGAKVGVSARTVRYYAARHVLPAPQFRGSATRYLREHLIHLAAIRHLQREYRHSLDAIRQHLNRLTAPELERLASLVLPEFAPPPPPPLPSSPPPGDAWHRVTVVPGLEIHLHAAAGAEVAAIAERIVHGIRAPRVHHRPA